MLFWGLCQCCSSPLYVLSRNDCFGGKECFCLLVTIPTNVSDAMRWEICWGTALGFFRGRLTGQIGSPRFFQRKTCRADWQPQMQPRQRPQSHQSRIRDSSIGDSLSIIWPRLEFIWDKKQRQAGEPRVLYRRHDGPTMRVWKSSSLPYEWGTYFYFFHQSHAMVIWFRQLFMPVSGLLKLGKQRSWRFRSWRLHLQSQFWLSLSLKIFLLLLSFLCRCFFLRILLNVGLKDASRSAQKRATAGVVSRNAFLFFPACILGYWDCTHDQIHVLDTSRSSNKEISILALSLNENNG